MMIPKQNPFSLFDFLGYFLPGAIFLFIALKLYFHLDISSPQKTNNLSPDTKSAYHVIVNLNESRTLTGKCRLKSPITEIHGDLIATKPDEGSCNNKIMNFEIPWVTKPEHYVPFIIFAYVAGLVLSFLSSITVEKYSLWTLGYPSKYIIGLHNKNGFLKGDDKAKSECGRILLRLGTACFLLPIFVLDQIVGNQGNMRDTYASEPNNFIQSAILISIVRFYGKFLTGIKCEDLIEGKQREINNLARPALISEQCDLINVKLRGLLDNIDFFTPIQNYVDEHADKHLMRSRNYLALYGLFRSLALLSTLLFWLTIICLLVYYFGNHDFLPLGVLHIWGVFCLNGVLSFLYYAGFVKFYRRFTFDALMALVVLEIGPDIQKIHAENPDEHQ